MIVAGFYRVSSSEEAVEFLKGGREGILVLDMIMEPGDRQPGGLPADPGDQAAAEGNHRQRFFGDRVGIQGYRR